MAKTTAARKVSKLIPSRLYIAAEVSMDNRLVGFEIATTDAEDASNYADSLRSALNDYETFPRIVALELSGAQRQAIQDALGVK